MSIPLEEIIGRLYAQNICINITTLDDKIYIYTGDAKGIKSKKILGINETHKIAPLLCKEAALLFPDEKNSY